MLPQQAIFRGLLEGFLQLVSVFIEASQNFIFYILHNKAAKKFLLNFVTGKEKMCQIWFSMGFYMAIYIAGVVRTARVHEFH